MTGVSKNELVTKIVYLTERVDSAVVKLKDIVGDNVPEKLIYSTDSENGKS